RHDVRAAQRLGRIVAAHQARVIGRDAYRQRPLVAADGGALVRRQFEDTGEFCQRTDAGAKLPMPVVPFRGGRPRIEALIELARFGTHRKAQRRQFRPAANPRDLCCFFSLAAATAARLGTHGPQRRLEFSPPQHLQTHRRLMTLHGSRLESPSDFPSNGVPARGYLEASSPSSSETAANTEEITDLPSIGHTYSESIDDKLL